MPQLGSLQAEATVAAAIGCSLVDPCVKFFQGQSTLGLGAIHKICQRPMGGWVGLVGLNNTDNG